MLEKVENAWFSLLIPGNQTKS